VELVRFTWVLPLTLAALIAVGGQSWAFDLPAMGQGDSTVTVLDDGLVADCASPHAEPVVPPTGPVMIDFSPPADRLVISELFRPPRRAAVV